MNQVGSASRTATGRAAGVRHRWTRRAAAVVGFGLLSGLVAPTGFAAEAASDGGLGRPKLSAPRVDDVSPFTARVNRKTAELARKAAAADQAAAKRASADRRRDVTWPSGGKAKLSLDSGGTATANAGSLPVTLSKPKATPGRMSPQVTVQVLDQRAAREIGVKGVVLTASAPARGGSARLGIDYSAFASAYGGDWAGRLHVVQLPACALTTPGKPGCRKLTPLTSTNRRHRQQLQADLTFAPRTGADTRRTTSPQTTVLAVMAGAKSGGGDYKATPLAASSTWEAGGSSGSFTWKYPLRTPPAAAGPAPSLGIAYDSGSVDGRTANTNNQGTWLGEGFDLTSSYIERKYHSCDDDGQDDKFDLCWKYENASLVLNGRASELVKDDTSGAWRLKNDDASKVTRSTGADNGDDNGEHWTVTTGDGTRYVFGLNKLDGAGADDRTESVWTVPVFGDDDGEPGYSSGSTFADRDKKQAWRWNLDYVVDPHGNAMTYWYKAETNNYAKNGDDDPGASYTRGGYLKEIRYGQREGSLFSATPEASNKVVFSTAERCLASGTGCDALTEDSRDNWPDVPFDSVCKDGEACTGNVGPSFFSRKRLTGVTTYAWDAAAETTAFAAVDSWSFKQLYLDPGDTGDSSDQTLWLDEIVHTGKPGTDVTLDPVRFDHQFLMNRVDGATDDILSLEKPRLRTITSETGAQTIIDYAEQECVAGSNMPGAPDSNTKRCFPVYWSPNGAADPQLDWFHKYPVTGVRTTDPRGGSEAVAHTYSYAGGGAWHYNDDPMTPSNERTWSIWRGFGKVTHLTGTSDSTRSKTVTVYLRGMDGDRKADGTKRSIQVTGIKAAAIDDKDQYAGFTRESVTYNGADEVSGTINDPWSKRTATQHKSYADTEAYYVRTAASHARTRITSGLEPRDRVRTTTTTFDDYGMPSTVEDRGDTAVDGDEKCTRTWYARNDEVGINSLVARTRMTSEPCSTSEADLDLPADSSRPGDVLSDTAVAYDSTTWSASQSPTKGEARWTGRAKGYTGEGDPTWQKVAATTYDSLGRPKAVTDTLDRTVATTTYAPAAAGPLTSTTVVNAKGHETTTVVDPFLGSPVKVTDPNNKITETEYDGLGRVTKVWLPNRLKVLNQTPNYVYDYSVTAAAPSWVSTGTLNNGGSGYNTTYEIFDSLLRTRQIQAPSPVGGRVIAETLYDDRGLSVTTNADIYDDTAAPSGTLVATDGGQAPAETDTTYDGAGRATKSVTKNYGVTRWTTTTSYTGDTVATTAPSGGSAAAVVTDALGQTTSRREYAGESPTGATYTTTAFTYTASGQQKTVKGPDGATWSYTYDLFGRQITADDPDKGEATTTYNALDQISSTSDAEGRSLSYEYDDLGRKTGMWGASKTDAEKLAAWTYDTAAKGQQDTSTRYDGGVSGKAYTKKVTAYDPLYRPRTSELRLPSSDPLVAAGVPGTLSFSTGYRADGTISQHREPGAGGLPSETVGYTYNTSGQLLSFKGTTGYLQGAAYSPLGDLRQLTLGTSSATDASKLYLNHDYEAGTRRLTRSYATDDTHGYMLQELNYKQDDAGNVTSISDSTTLGGTSEADHQCFTYDGYRRLTEAWTPKTNDCAASGRTTANLDGAAPYWTSYSYNSAGQRATQTDHETSGDTTTTYTYGSPGGQPHALAKTETSASTSTYAYDETGNTTKRPGSQAQQTLAWNSEGQLVSATEPAAGGKPATGTSYLYDADGELLIRRATTTDGETVLYLGTTEFRLTVSGDGTTKKLSGTRYYAAAGQTIAVRTATSGVSGSKLSFLASDHHATSSVAVDSVTQAVTKRYTTPFGAPRGATPSGWPDDKAFLGKPADTTTGLTHIGAREYDPSTGQFISVDPILNTAQAQSLNGYSYAQNTPVTLADPTGLDAADYVCQNSGNKDGCYHDFDQGGPSDVHNADEDYCTGCGTSTIGGGGGGTHLSGGDTGGGFTGWLKGLTDTAVSYGSAIVTTPEIWWGAAEAAGGMLLMGVGGSGEIVGGALCLTVIGCVAGAPAVAVSTSLIVAGAYGTADGLGRINNGLNKAFSEARANTGSSENAGNALGGARETRVADIVSGRIPSGEPGKPGLLIKQPNVGTTDVDVIGADGAYIAVGGKAKAKDLAKLGQKLNILKWGAGRDGVPAKAYFQEGTPDPALNLARKVLGDDNVHIFGLG